MAYLNTIQIIGKNASEMSWFDQIESIDSNFELRTMSGVCSAVPQFLIVSKSTKQIMYISKGREEMKELIAYFKEISQNIPDFDDFTIELLIRKFKGVL